MRGKDGNRADSAENVPAARRLSDWSALMVKAQAGDAIAYRTLLSAITPYLRALARRSGLAGDDVEDGVQDVLLTLHSVRHTYDPARPFGPWLVVIARNRLTDRRRSRARVSNREIELTEFHETFATDESNLLEAASDARRLHAIIADLPAGQRQAVEMLRLRELSLKEAAAASGQSETALKVALHRAVKRLRVLMDGF